MRVSGPLVATVSVLLCVTLTLSFLYVTEKMSGRSGFHAVMVLAPAAVNASVAHSMHPNHQHQDHQQQHHVQASSPSSSPSLSPLLSPPKTRWRKEEPPKPVLISIIGHTGQHPFPLPLQSKQFAPGKPWVEKGCTTEGGLPLSCTFSVDPKDEATADGLYFQLPSHPGAIRERAYPGQLRFAVSEESPTYYPQMEDKTYMAQFDAEVTLRSCSQVPAFFYERIQDNDGRVAIDTPVVPFERKEHALVYMNSNCYPPSGRGQIIAGLLDLKDQAKVPVHSYGECNNNRQAVDDKGIGSQGAKHAIISKYKFCVAIENSISFEYTTEKVWEALTAGCVPIYMGTHNIREMVPEPGSIIVYGPGGDVDTPAALDALMHRIGSDRAVYEGYLAWKNKPVTALSQYYQDLLRQVQHTNECRMCRFVVQHRLDPGRKYTTCMFNDTWLQSKARYEAERAKSMGAATAPVAAR